MDLPRKVQPVLSRINAINAGRASYTSLVCMDLEFNSTTGRLYEVAICTLLPQEPEILINALTERDVELPWHLNWENPLRNELVWFQQRSRVESNARAGRILTSTRIMEILKTFLTPDTLILTWHQSTRDLRILRQFSESNGHESIRSYPPTTTVFL